SRDELEIILRGVADGITVQDASGKLIYANDAAALLTGCATVDELLKTPIPELLGRYEMFDEAGNPFPLEQLPGRVAMKGRQGPATMIRFRVVASGAEHWSLVSATPVLDQQGRPRYAINIFHDVTERKRTEGLQDFLVEATELLATDLDYEETLYRVAHIATPFLADVCVFDILQPDSVIRRIAAHPDPETERHIHELVRRHPIEPEHPAMRAIVSGETSLFEAISPTVFERIGMEAERASMIAELGFRSVVVVPLVARGRRIGALSLSYTTSGRRYSAADLPVVHELARRSATAIDNALLYHESRQAAARLRALAEASHAFAEASLDLPTVLDSVAQSAGKLIGDQCILRLLSDDGTLLPAVALYHPDPARLSHLTELMANEVQRADEGLVGSVMTTGAPVLIPTISHDELRRAITIGHRDDIERVPLHSIVIVQVRVRERVIGTLGLGRERTGDPYTEEDLLLLQELADRAGLAIENARLYREARNAVRSREQFLSVASHELKTPLTSVKASAQLLGRRLRQEPIDRDRVETLVGQLQSEIIRLESLVLDLLDATRIQQGRLELRREQVNLVDLARQAIERFESSPQRLPGHELILDAAGPVQAMIDPGRIDQVITNLVSNALKYSPDGGEVRVVVSALDDGVEIAISDTGIGI
ncbi:MAG: GAF domain-containing protein, partial [Thermomicrobiales bacterium]